MSGEPAATARAAAPAPAAAVAEHVAALSQDAAAMVRQEVDALRGELRSTIRKAAGASMLLGVAGACGALALGSSGVLVVRVLDRFAPPRLSAALATGLFGAGAALAATHGWQTLHAALEQPAKGPVGPAV